MIKKQFSIGCYFLAQFFIVELRAAASFPGFLQADAADCYYFIESLPRRRNGLLSLRRCVWSSHGRFLNRCVRREKFSAARNISSRENDNAL
jgi:hypothetical protein